MNDIIVKNKIATDLPSGQENAIQAEDLRGVLDTMVDYTTEVIDVVDNLDSIGILNASTGVATIESGNITLTATPPTGWISGQSVTVQTVGNIGFGGVNFTSGTTLQIGDELRKRGNQWELIRFEVSDNSISLQKLELSIENILSAFSEMTEFESDSLFKLKAGDKRILEVTKDGFLKALFDFSLKKIATNDISGGAITSEKLESSISTLLQLLTAFSEMSEFESNSLFKLKSGNKRVLEITNTGYLKALFDFSLKKIATSDISDNAITSAKLESSISILIQLLTAFSEMDEFESNSILKVASGGKKVLEVTKDGLLRALFDFSLKKIATSDIDTDFSSRLPTVNFINQEIQNDNDVIVEEGFENNRFEVASTSVKTHRVGELYSVTAIPAKEIEVYNQTGTDIEVSTIAPMPNFQKNLGVFSNTFFQGTVQYKGLFQSTSSSLPASPAVGDYYICVFLSGDPTTLTLFGLTVKRWNIIAYKSTGWEVIDFIDFATCKTGDYFQVNSNLSFFGISFLAGEYILYSGLKSGLYKEPLFRKNNSNEEIYCGLFTPSVGISSPVQNGVYCASVSGTFNGFTLEKGDFVTYKNSIYGVVKTKKELIPNNSFAKCSIGSFLFARRVDLSNTVVSADVKYKTNKPIRKISTSMVLYSDSMFGTGGVDTSIKALLPNRTIKTQSFGGGTSENVIEMVKFNYENGDEYKNRLHCFWHGQNNNTDIAQVKNSATYMQGLLGTTDAKFVMWSMLGQHICGFNGTRIVVSIHEDANNPAIGNRFSDIEKYYDSVFGKKHFATRKQALQASLARTRKHILFPGMTEGQVASTYGIPAFSFWFKYEEVLWNPDTINFVGYYSTAGLPTGGSNNDYYIRTANGTIGNVLVKYNDVWVEHTFDNTHFSVEGGQNIAQKFVDFLTILKY